MIQSARDQGPETLFLPVYKGIISKRVFCASFDVSFISLDFHQNSVLLDLQHHKLYDLCMYIYIYIYTFKYTHTGISTYTLDPAPLPVRVPRDG